MKNFVCGSVTQENELLLQSALDGYFDALCQVLKYQKLKTSFVLFHITTN
jgi:hypothetical protein